MHLKAVKYKDTHLAPGSEAHALHADKKFQELDQHLKKLDAEAKALLGRYGAQKVVSSPAAPG